MRSAALAVLLVGCGFSVGASTTDSGADTAPDVPVLPSGVRKLVLDNTGITSTLDDVPVLVAIGGQVDRTKVIDPRKDLKFEDPATSAVLSFEVEAFNPVGEILVWVRVPHIPPAPAESAILLTVGSAVGATAPEQVWTAYEQVQHFTGTSNDSTAQHHDGTATGAVITGGYLAGSMTFGTAARVSFAGQTLDQWSEATLEMWIRPKYAGTTDIGGLQPAVIDNGGSFRIGRFYLVSTSLVFQIDVAWSGATSYLHPVLPFDTWSHVAWAYAGDTMRVYVDGVQVLSDTVGVHNLANSDSALVLGNAVNGAKMEIDEFRISKTGRSADWMRIQHRSMTRGLVTFTNP
ncbi:MAG: LamG domain-containing protein [Myxococcales bacterium]|nr:LamG domain-containing protein [Myxococcales bacterium]